MTVTEYLIIRTGEEGVEVSHRASKAVCFGITETQEGHTQDNLERMKQEFNDLYACMQVLHERGLFEEIIDEDYIQQKRAKLSQYLLYSIEQGIVDTPWTFSSIQALAPEDLLMIDPY